MSVLTRTDLWEMASGRHAPFKPPSEFIWLEVLRRGILHRMYASVHWGYVRSLERTIHRILNGEIPDVDPEAINESRRIGVLIASLSEHFRCEADETPFPVVVNLGTGMRRKPAREPKGE